MGMFDAFLGRDSRGYTSAQAAGLRRSEKIKERRAEKEVFAEKELQELKGRQEMERLGVTELGETTRSRMREAGESRRSFELGAGRERSRTEEVEGRFGRQELIGEQQVGLAGRETIAAANLASVQRGHEKTLAEMEIGARAKEGPGDYKSFTETIPGTMGQTRTGFFSPSKDVTKYPASPGEVAGETGMADFSNVGEPTLSKLYAMSTEEQSQYLDWLEKNDPEGFMVLKEEYTKLMAPKKEGSSAW